VREATLPVGGSVAIDGYRITNLGPFRQAGPNWVGCYVRLGVFRGGSADGALTPGLRSYDGGNASNEVDIRTSYLTGTDLYGILQGTGPGCAGASQVKLLVNPAVGLVWLAGVVFLAGALVAMWPDPREARQLARRYGELLARGEA
jgi:cytochrome c biogenesis factor